MTDVTVLDELLGGLAGTLGGLFRQMEWAEDEIAQAMQRHPAHSEVINEAFGILMPSLDLMSTEFVYRSHVRELLERLATGGDTRLATNAEVACACSEISQVAPMKPAGALVYMRAWRAAFPEHEQVFKDVDSYEVVASDEADFLDRDMRRKLRQADRTITITKADAA
jgi:hypothetical protein